MWNRTGQSDQEVMGPSSQHQSHPPHGLKHPPQPMQAIVQDKSCSSGKLESVFMHLYVGDRVKRGYMEPRSLTVLTSNLYVLNLWST